MQEIRKIQENAIYKSLVARSDSETADKIVYGEDGASRGEDNAAWVKSTMRRLEDSFDQEMVKQVRMDCQCGYGMDEKLALVRDLMSAAKSLEEFASSDKAKSAGLFYKDSGLYLQFPFCPCPMLANVERLETNTWCQCTTGYSKVLFEKAFGCIVDVELLKSIKMGDDICLMQIIPQGEIWE